MKALIIINILFWTILSTAFAAKTHIFLIHGINSNTDSSFYRMPDALKKVLHKRSDRDFIIKTFDYETGNDTLSTFDFAEKFNNFVINHFMSEGFDPLVDKISLVAHSQGGLVSLVWINQSFKGSYATDFHKNLDTFISLGSPFWGTSIILLPITLKKTIGRLFGRTESIEMLWGSYTTDYLLSDLNTPKSSFRDYLENKNIINVTANARGYPNTATLSRLMDDDTAVPVTSSNLNYYYTIDNDLYYKEGRVIASEKSSNISKQYIVKGLHTSNKKLGEWFKVVQGMAQVPKNCIKDEYCKHVSYEYIWKGLLHIPQKQKDTKTARKTNSFAIDLDLTLDHPDSGTKEFKFEFWNANGSKLDKDIKLKLLYDRKASDYYNKAQSRIRYIFIGKIKDKKDHKILMKVKHKGNRFLSKSYKITIAPKKATFIKGKLIRFNHSY